MTTDHSLTMPEHRPTGSRPGPVGPVGPEHGPDTERHAAEHRAAEHHARERHRDGGGALTGSERHAGPVRQAWVILTARYLRQLYRVPVVIFMTLIQPVIWLLLFGALFKRVAEIPGFGGGSYVTYLTPGVVIMTAMFSASWTGMAYIEDMQNGVMDRFLTAPVSRGAMTAAMLGYQGLTTVLQSAIIIGIGWGIGATFPGGAVGIAALIGVSVLIAVTMAGLSNWFALLTRQREALIGASTTLVMPLTFLSGAFLSLRLVPGWIAGIARYNPVNWAASAGRIAVENHPAWTTVRWRTTRRGRPSAPTRASWPWPWRSPRRRPPGGSAPTSGRCSQTARRMPVGGSGRSSWRYQARVLKLEPLTVTLICTCIRKARLISIACASRLFQQPFLVHPRCRAALQTRRIGS